MAFFGWATVFPASKTLRIAMFALGTCYAIELFKFYQAPWIVSVRHSTLGHLVFGHAFSWRNLVAYTLGVLAGVGIEYGLRDYRSR